MSAALRHYCGTCGEDALDRDLWRDPDGTLMHGKLGLIDAPHPVPWEVVRVREAHVLDELKSMLCTHQSEEQQ